jgi:hypothetical protein
VPGNGLCGAEESVLLACAIDAFGFLLGYKRGTAPKAAADIVIVEQVGS